MIDFKVDPDNTNTEFCEVSGIIVVPDKKRIWFLFCIAIPEKRIILFLCGGI